MSREIKFRAWYAPEKQMCDWDFIQLELGHYNKPFESTDEWKVMQYTGLKDKNGREVYQGDILKITRDKANYGHTSYGGFAEVTAQTCGYGLRCFNPSFDELEQYPLDEDGDIMTWDSSSLWHIEDDNGRNIEVTGNVYENPELLTQRKDGDGRS